MKTETNQEMTSIEEVSSIENFTIWNPSCQISLWKDIEDDIYNASIDIFLSEEPTRCITTMTQIWCKDPLCVIRQAFECVYTLYEDVCEHVMVINFEDGSLLEEEYNISQAFDSDECEEQNSNIVNVSM